MFSGCTVPPDSKETELGSSNQEVSPSGSKNSISGGVDISQAPGCHLLRQVSSQ